MSSQHKPSNDIVSDRTPENPLTIQLHPLVLLTISDYITRHTLRGLQGPLFGAIIGQQSGRTCTLEHAYECTTTQSTDNEDVLFDPAFFTQRLEQYKAVHKAPTLDLTAVFMLGPEDGAQARHLPPLLQAQKLSGNDNLLLLLFHPGMIDKIEGGRLPITIYEPFEEQDGRTQLWERGFEVETGEAEMIGINYVAKGSTNVQQSSTSPRLSNAENGGSSNEKKAKGKSKAKEDSAESDAVNANANIYSEQDDELLSALRAKANAIRMLKRRLDLIHAYLRSLPPSTLTDATSTELPSTANLALLRNINSMIGRLSLLSPNTVKEDVGDKDGISLFAQASAKENNDVQLTSLLAALTRSIADAQNLGMKYSDIQRERMSKERGGGVRLGPMLNDGLMDTGGTFTLQEAV